jgi:hypothetical protein
VAKGIVQFLDVSDAPHARMVLIGRECVYSVRPIDACITLPFTREIGKKRGQASIS